MIRYRTHPVGRRIAQKKVSGTFRRSKAQGLLMLESSRHLFLGNAVGRHGFSLLEVLVALAIFLFGLIAIGQLITLGSDRALEVQFQTQAVQLCQAKMAEVVAGAVPLSSQADAKFDEDPDWSWSLEAEQDSSSSLLWNVKVTVTHPRPDGSKMEASLSQMVLDPSQRGSATDAALSSSSSASSQDNSNSNSSGSTSNTAGSSSPTTSNTTTGGKSP